MHSSLTFLVSGQAQQIFFLGFESGGEAAFPDSSSFLDGDNEIKEAVPCAGNPLILKMRIT